VRKYSAHLLFRRRAALVKPRHRLILDPANRFGLGDEVL
jgi:hypothetical protein